MTAHEWRVDAIEEGIAALEVDGQRLMHLPLWMLPSGVREGDVVRAELAEPTGDDRSAVRFAIDRDATRAALERSRRQIESTPPQNDPGGDIRL